MKHHRLDHVCDINLYTSKGDGNWITTVSIGRLTTRDINLCTSRGDGNLSRQKSSMSATSDINLITREGTETMQHWNYQYHLNCFDINLSTSRGDGNFPALSAVYTLDTGYKPICLERGRKPGNIKLISLTKSVGYKPIYLGRGRKLSIAFLSPTATWGI